MNPVEYALKIFGWMREVELSWLSEKAARLKTGSVWLEVGTWMGRSWSCVALSLPEKSSIIAVDTFSGENAEPMKYVQEHGSVLPDFMRVFHDVRSQRPTLVATILETLSIHAADSVPDDYCDVIFIDGDHRTHAVRSDIETWLPKLKPGGLLCGHDGDDPEVLAALNDLNYTMDPSERGSIWCLA